MALWHDDRRRRSQPRNHFQGESSPVKESNAGAQANAAALAARFKSSGSQNPWFIGVHLSRRSLGEGGFVVEMITNHNSLITSHGKKWAVRVSNPRPSRCKRDALPLS